MATPGEQKRHGLLRGRTTLFSKGYQRSRPKSYYFENFVRAYRSWLLPYLKARFMARNFSPVLAYLYTDLNCNLDCPYCFLHGRNIPGMTMDMGRRAVDWLESAGCRVLAYMGGEPLVRKDYIVDLTRYATEKGFFVYLPTNGILLDRAFVDAIGKAGVSTINLAVDAVEKREGISKYFTRVKPQLELLVEKEKEYGFITFLNINITKYNIEDVKTLTHIAHDYGIASDYHINEPPQITYDSFKHEDDGGWIESEDILEVDRLVDWLIEKNLEGYTMVNSIRHLRAMKQFIRGILQPWPCQAGRLTMIIRVDGSFAPCFELYGSEENWGSVQDGPAFDPEKLLRQKKRCNSTCLSTCNFQVAHYTQSFLYSLQWLGKHAYARYFGVS